MSALPTSPYKGLNAFDDSELDALLFFGREREREIVVANLIASRLTVLYGPSGVGKSSLLRAAVARSLRELPEEPLVVVFSSWSDDPARGARRGRRRGWRESTPSALRSKRSSARRPSATCTSSSTRPRSTSCTTPTTAGRARSPRRCRRSLAAPLRVNVLVSLREDSLAKLDRFTGASRACSRTPFDSTGSTARPPGRRSSRPVERFERAHRASRSSVEPELVERVLDEVGAGRIEPALGGLGAVEGDDDAARIEAPYLQLVMQRLWEEERAAGSATLRAATLERWAAPQHIVEEHLEGAMDELTPEQKDIAARLFDHLVTPSGTKIAHEASDLADFAGVSPDEIDAVTAHARRPPDPAHRRGRPRCEIFHDVLAGAVLAWKRAPRGGARARARPGGGATVATAASRSSPRALVVLAAMGRDRLRAVTANRGARAGSRGEGERARRER